MNGGRRCGPKPKSCSSKVRPTPASMFMISRRSPRLVTNTARCSSSTMCSRRRFCKNLWRWGLIASSIRRPSISMGGGRCLGGVILGSREFCREGSSDISAPDRTGAVALQCMGAIEIARNLAFASEATDGERGADRRLSQRSSRRSAGVIYPGRADHPQAEIVKRQMSGRRHAGQFRRRRRQGGRVCFRQPAGADQNFQQSRRRQKPHHPSGDDDASAADAAGPRRLGVNEGLLRLSVGLEDVEESYGRPFNSARGARPARGWRRSGLGSASRLRFPADVVGAKLSASRHPARYVRSRPCTAP